MKNKMLGTLKIKKEIFERGVRVKGLNNGARIANIANV